MGVFRDLVPVEDLTDLRPSVAAERVKAEMALDWAMRGYGKLGQGLFKALDLTPPEAKPKNDTPKDPKAASPKTETKAKKAKGGRT